MGMPARFCGHCGSPRVAERDQFCRTCGAPFGPAPSPIEPASQPPETGWGGAPVSTPLPTWSPRPPAPGASTSRYTPNPASASPPWAPWTAPASQGAFPPHTAASVGRRQRPVWLVVLLTLATGGLYFLWWVGATWAEMKRGVGDPSMSPFWHAVASQVPIYGWFRVYAHYQTLEALARRATSPTRAHPALAVAGFVISGTGLRLAGSVAELIWPQEVHASTVVVTAVQCMLLATIVVHGQSVLNSYWVSLCPGVAARIHWVEWLVLVGLSCLWVLVLLVAIAGSPG